MLAKIILYVISGCAACNIQKHNIEEALKQTKKKGIEFEVINLEDIPKREKRHLQINDVPVTCFYQNDVQVFHYEGSYPTTVINRWIDIYIK